MNVSVFSLKTMIQEHLCFENMNNPQISIIVPVYKTESFLCRCLDSLLSQTLNDFELLLIDDGSPDRSGEICDEYAQRDSRIRVFHKENGGVASARQFGMDHAQGEFVIHADPDDWVESNMLEDLYHEAVEKSADLIICDFFVDDDKYAKQEPSGEDHMIVLKDLFQRLHGSCWNKLVRRSCYEKYDVTFSQNLSFCEDLTFWVKFLKNPIKISYLPKAYYHYVLHDDSIVHSYMNRESEEGWKVLVLLKDELKEFPDICRLACSRMAYLVTMDALRSGNFNTFSFFRRYYRYVPFILRYKEIPLKRRLLLSGTCFGLYSFYKGKL